MGQVLAALQKGDTKLVKSLPLPEIKDVRLETAKKIEASKQAWQLYKEAMMTKAEAESQFCLARKWIDDYHQRLQYNNSLLGNTTKQKYYNHLNSVKSTVCDNKVTYAYNLATSQYDLLLRYTFPLDVTDFKNCSVKTISSSSLDLFSTIRKTMKVSSAAGMSREQLVELLLELVRKEIPGLVESVQNREMTPEQIFTRITACLTEEHDLEKIQLAITRIKRNPGTQLALVVNQLEKLHLELLQCLEPFASLSSLEEKNKDAVLELMTDFCEPQVAKGIKGYISTCRNTNRKFTIKSVLEFASQLERKPGHEYELKSTKSINPTSFKASAFFNNLSPRTVEMMRKNPKGFNKFDKKKDSDQKKKFSPNTRGGKKAQNGNKGPGSDEAKRVYFADKQKTRGNQNKSAKNMNKDWKKTDKQKTGCIICGYKCLGQVDYKGLKCKFYPNSKPTKNNCKLCNKGKHESSSQCYELFRLFGQKN